MRHTVYKKKQRIISTFLEKLNMREQSHCCFRNQKILMQSDIEINPFKKVRTVWNDFMFVIPACQSFKLPIQRCTCQIVCECGILRVGAICDISQNMLWYAPKYKYLIQIIRALKQCGWAQWNLWNNWWNNSICGETKVVAKPNI